MSAGPMEVLDEIPGFEDIRTGPLSIMKLDGSGYVKGLCSKEPSPLKTASWPVSIFIQALTEKAV